MREPTPATTRQPLTPHLDQVKLPMAPDKAIIDRFVWVTVYAVTRKAIDDRFA